MRSVHATWCCNMHVFMTQLVALRSLMEMARLTPSRAVAIGEEATAEFQIGGELLIRILAEVVRVHLLTAIMNILFHC